MEDQSGQNRIIFSSWMMVCVNFAFVRNFIHIHFLLVLGGSWVLSERHLCQFKGGNSIYFGTVDNLYLNTPLPTIGEHR